MTEKRVKIFGKNEIMAKNSPNLMEDIHLHNPRGTVNEKQNTLKRAIPRHYTIIKLLKDKDKQRILKGTKVAHEQ